MLVIVDAHETMSRALREIFNDRSFSC